MSAKDTLRRNKTAIQSILSKDEQLILNKVFEKEIITEREYNKIKSINKDSSESRVIEIVDTIRDKGEAKCRNFLELLKTDEDIKETYPSLQDIELNYTEPPPRPRQDTGSTDNRGDVAPESNRQNQSEKTSTNLCLPMSNWPVDGNVRRGCDIDAGDADDETEYYTLTHNPRGWCVVINIEKFTTAELRNRAGSQEDTKALREVFTLLGFKVDVVNDLTAEEIRIKLQNLSRENFLDHDALVVCVLSNGERGVVYGSDGHLVSLEELTQPFTGDRAPTLAGKPKLFFIQACQGSGYQRGAQPYPPQSCPPQPCPPQSCPPQPCPPQSCPPQPRRGEFNLTRPEPTQETAAYHYIEVNRKGHLEEDASAHVSCETVASNADFLMGMATLPGYRSFRHRITGSIYIQELCRQLMRSGGSSNMDDILTILTRVNREVNKLNLMNYKQMPQPSYTLTKRLVLKFV